MTTNRLKMIEDELDREYESSSPNQAKIDRLEREADELAEKQEKLRAQQEQIELELAEARNAKVTDILDLVRSGDQATLVERYGHEFIDDYEIVEGGVMTKLDSFHYKAGQVIKAQDPLSKLRQLVYYRIYDQYVRGSNKSRDPV